MTDSSTRRKRAEEEETSPLAASLGAAAQRTDTVENLLLLCKLQARVQAESDEPDRGERRPLQLASDSPPARRHHRVE